MDDKGQVYFNADDEEIPEEDAARYQEALEAVDRASPEAVRALLEEIRALDAAEAERARTVARELTDKQRAHIEKRTRFEEALRAQAEALDRQGESEAE